MDIDKKSIEFKFKMAERLYVKQLYNGAETARRVNVTPKTLCGWVKKHNWNELRDKTVNELIRDTKGKPTNPTVIIQDLIAYIEDKSPLLAKAAKPVITEYLTLIS